MSEFIVEHKGETFRQERDVFFQSISTASADSLKSKLAAEDIQLKSPITRQIELFVTARENKSC